jgi:hypothetical protein
MPRHVVILAICALCISHVLCASKASESDVKRAITQRPRPEFRGKGSLADANQVLNLHLTKMKMLKTRPCETFSSLDLQEISALLFGAADSALLKVYDDVQDNRRQIYERRLKCKKISSVSTAL